MDEFELRFNFERGEYARAARQHLRLKRLVRPALIALLAVCLAFAAGYCVLSMLSALSIALAAVCALTLIWAVALYCIAPARADKRPAQQAEATLRFSRSGLALRRGDEPVYEGWDAVLDAWASDEFYFLMGGGGFFAVPARIFEEQPDALLAFDGALKKQVGISRRL